MKPQTYWIILANSSYAEIYEMKGREIHLLERREHPQGRQKVQDIVSDKPGRTLSSASSERHSLGEEEDRVHRHEQNLFIHELRDLCAAAKVDRRFDKLIFVAPPRFLGEMRKIFEKHFLAHCFERDITKDLPAYLSAHERLQALQEELYSYC